MKYSKTCECCGHKETAYTFKLNAGLVNCLKKLVDFYVMSKGDRARPKYLDLTNSEYSNFPKLRYWGFAHKSEGGWVPTQRGVKFLDDKIAAFSIVGIMNDELIPSTHEAWDTHTTPITPVYASDLLGETRYKQREEYQEEKGRTNASLFDN